MDLMYWKLFIEVIALMNPLRLKSNRESVDFGLPPKSDRLILLNKE
jgi:hypothetical protein